MAGPWEQYQQAAPAAAGPWSNYQSSGIPTDRKLTREELIAQIPGQDGRPVPNLTTPERDLGIIEQAVSLPLTAATVITGAPATLAGAWGELLGGKKTGESIQRALTFPVYTEAQARQLQTLGRTAEDLKIPPTLGGAGIPLNAMAGPALAQTTNAMRQAGGAVSKAAEPFVQQPLAQRAARIAQEESTKAWQRAPEIEASQAAQRVGAVLNPARSNPTAGNKMLVGAVGESNLNYEMSQKNLPVWNDTARRSLGLPENTPLDEAALNAYRDRNSTSHLVIRNMGTLENKDAALSDLGKLRLNPKSTSNPDKINAVNSVVDRVQSQIESGLTGSEVLDQIRGFRNDAKVTLRRVDAKPADIDVAKTNLKIANTLEKLIENNIADDSVVAQYRADRTALAKSYDWERAIDPITKQVDPNQLASDVRNGIKLTGELKDLADVAGTFPEIASMRPVVTSDPYTMLRRGGVGGTIGFATLGGPEGAAIGAGASTLLGRAAAKRLATPESQLKRAIPVDKRLPLPEVQGMSRPDFVMQGSPYVPAPPTAPITAPNRLLGAPSAEGTMGSLAAERARANRMAYSLAEGADVRQAAAEAAARRPTSGEILFDLDPITGRLVPAQPQGTALPQMSALESAVQKMSGQMQFEPLPLAQRGPVGWVEEGVRKGAPIYKSQTTRPEIPASEFKKYALPTRQGQAFAMTAEEKIAWNKAKADLAEVMPGMKALSDEAIAAKMMDRDWAAKAVQNAYAKAEQLGKQEAALVEQLANRDNLRLMASEITAKQKQLAKIKAESQSIRDLADQMEETLRAARPDVSGKQQGPKTRAFQRNRLNPDQEVLNQLLGK